MVIRKPLLLLLLVCFCGKVCGQRTGTGPRDRGRGNPEYRPDQYDTGRGGGPTNTEVGLLPSTGTGAKDRMGVMDQDQSNSQGQLDSRQSNLFAVNLTHALAVDQGIAAAGGGEESYINILR